MNASSTWREIMNKVKGTTRANPDGDEDDDNCLVAYLLMRMMDGGY